MHIYTHTYIYMCVCVCVCVDQCVHRLVYSYEAPSDLKCGSCLSRLIFNRKSNELNDFEEGYVEIFFLCISVCVCVCEINAFSSFDKKLTDVVICKAFFA